MLVFVRVILPAVICLAGIAIVAARGADVRGITIGFMMISAGLSVWLTSYLFRQGTDDPHRREEEEARAYFDEHGRWPDDP